MSKNVLILSASPRKDGNSELLCGQFMRGAQDAGHHAEIVVLRDKNIGYCVACDACRQNGSRCVQKDDMAELLDRMMAADVIAMATPVYFYSMSAQLKTLIDRTYARYAALTGKELCFILTAADEDPAAMERTVEGFRGFVSCLDGASEKGVIYGVGAWQKGDIQESPAFGQAYEMGKSV
jgi:multimeric flavodoxin WrbA